MNASAPNGARRSSVLFAETQRFDQAWLAWLLRVVVLASLVPPLVLTLFVRPGPDGPSPLAHGVALAGSVAGALLVIGVAWLLRAARLESVVREEGVVVRFVPFHGRDKAFPREQIVAAGVVTYEALREYGGWGIRLGWGGRGWAYTTRGKHGARLELAGGERVLVGTQRPEQLAAALNALGVPRLPRPD